PMVAASEEEASLNPRARSAKLRAGIRTQAASPGNDLSIFNLPELASLARLGG
ncbi:MAG: 16S rRNA (cytosine(1402)-N(4))-methyltransferase RsmH, partial [Ensifer adhaerens]